MNRVELLKEFEDMLNHNLFCYSADYLMNTPKKQYVKEWEETKEKIDILKDLIKQEEQEKDSVYYMVKDEKNGVLKRCFWLNKATSFAEKKKKEYMQNYDRTEVWVEVNGDKEKIYTAKGYAKGKELESEETEEFE